MRVRWFKMTGMTDPVLVTHRGCMDGSTCVLVFLAAGGKEENVYFTNPGHNDTDELVNYLAETHDGSILVADVSISLGLATKLDQRSVDITLLDHHKSAIPLDKFEWCEIEIDNQRAGGRMLWDYLKSRTGPSLLWDYEHLVMAADDYDRWVREIPESEDLVTLHDAIEQDAFIERFRKDASITFSSKEKYLVEVFKKKRQRFIDHKKDKTVFFNRKVQGHNVKIGGVEAGTNQSILGDAICTDLELDCDIAMMVNGRSISFRASADCPVDLSKIAKHNGGGGHAKAAGVGIENILGEDFAEFIYKKIQWGAYSGW